MPKKCLECNGCTDTVWIIPRRFFWCAFCNVYYDIIDDKLTVIDVEKEMNIHMELLNSMDKENINERFK